jgi:hypothetical protein
MRIGPVFTLVQILVLAGFSITDALASDVRILQLPDSVIGTWAPSADDCSGSGRDAINISAKRHSTADATCEISWVTVTPSRDGPVYSARSICAKTKGGGGEPASYLVVTPRPDNKLLMRLPSANPDGELVTYRKCL